MERLDAVKKLIEQQETDLVEAARRVDTLQRALALNKDTHWALTKELHPDLVECKDCRCRQGIHTCRQCGGKTCFQCVNEDDDSDEIYTVYTCAGCAFKYIGHSAYVVSSFRAGNPS